MSEREQWLATNREKLAQAATLAGFLPDDSRIGSFAEDDPDVHFGVTEWELSFGRRTMAQDAFGGCLLGGALGDALGYPLEFWDTATILRQVGTDPPEDLTFSRSGPALITDDTQMTLFLAEGLIRAAQRWWNQNGTCCVPWVVVRALSRWLTTQTGKNLIDWDDPRNRGWLLDETRLHAQRAPGNTNLAALHTGRMWPENNSKGCGAVMRAAPIGLAAPNREWAFRMGRETGRLTHGHPSGYLSAAYLSSLIFDLAAGQTLESAMNSADRLLEAESNRGEMVRVLEKTRHLATQGPPSPATIEQLGGGWTGEEALAIALLCSLTADTTTPDGIRQALWHSVCHSGDSDSTGAIAGNILGSIVGKQGLPPKWLEQVEMREVVERIAVDLHAVTREGAILDFLDYPPN